MKRLGCAALLAILVAAPAASAQSPLGMGGVLCRDYLRAARNSDILYHQASQWLLGYASGMNGALKAMNGAEPAVGVSSDQALKSAMTTCDANPASTLAQAVEGWYAALPKQAAAEAKPEAKPETKSGNLMLNLDAAPGRKPLLDRH